MPFGSSFRDLCTKKVKYQLAKYSRNKIRSIEQRFDSQITRKARTHLVGKDARPLVDKVGEHPRNTFCLVVTQLSPVLKDEIL